MRLFEVDEIITKMNELATKYSAMDVQNSFVKYDDIIQSIKSNISGPLDAILKKVMEEKFPENVWLSWYEVIDVVRNWPLHLCPGIPLSNQSIQRIANILFFGFIEWRESWSNVS